MAAAGYFEGLALTDEDRTRTRQYQLNRSRQELAVATTDLDSYLRNLKMELQYSPFEELNLPRVVQLINKTNQFNLTTRRGWQMALMNQHNTAGMDATFALPTWLAAITDAGFNGVPLFFVLSAFTLTLRLSKGKDGLVSYFLRRICRIGPAYWLAALAYTALYGLGPRLFAPNGIDSTAFATASAFGSAWTGGAALAVVPGGWSVSVEVAFYVIPPLLVAWWHRRLWPILLLLLLATVALQWHATRHLALGLWDVAARIRPPNFLPVFLCGSAAATLANRLSLPDRPAAIAILLGVAILVLPQLSLDERIITPYVPFAMLVAAATALAARHPDIHRAF